MPVLEIKIPKQEYDMDLIIKRLRYIETPEYRKKVSEAYRLQELSELTKQFKQAIMLRDSLLLHKSFEESKIDIGDPLYS